MFLFLCKITSWNHKKAALNTINFGIKIPFLRIHESLLRNLRLDFSQNTGVRHFWKAQRLHFKKKKKSALQQRCFCCSVVSHIYIYSISPGKEKSTEYGKHNDLRQKYLSDMRLMIYKAFLTSCGQRLVLQWYKFCQRHGLCNTSCPIER